MNVGRPSEAWFPRYGLLTIKESAWSVRLEIPCRNCRRQTSGTLFSSTKSELGCLPRFPTNVFPELLQDVALQTRIHYGSRMMVLHHIFFLHFGNTWTTFFRNNGRDDVDQQRRLPFIWFKFLRFLSLGMCKLNHFSYRSQSRPEIANSEYRMDLYWFIHLKFSNNSGGHCSNMQNFALRLKVDILNIFFNLKVTATQKPCFRRPMFISFHVLRCRFTFFSNRTNDSGRNGIKPTFSSICS